MTETEFAPDRTNSWCERRDVRLLSCRLLAKSIERDSRLGCVLRYKDRQLTEDPCASCVRKTGLPQVFC